MSLANTPINYAAMKVFIDDGTSRNLTWKERLLSWPWKPWVKVEFIPGPEDGEVLYCRQGMVMNSKTNLQMYDLLHKE